MTLLIAARFDGGAIIGADSGLTFAAGGQSTIMLAGPKVDTLDGRGLVAVSGPVGLGQRFTAEVRDALDKGQLGTPATGAMVAIASRFRPHLYQEIQAAQAFMPIGGQQKAYGAVSTSTVVAVCLQDGPHLFSFDEHCAPEETSVDLPFVTVGSGQLLGDPFMAFLRKVFWPEGILPSRAEATLAILWALEIAIGVAPGGLAAPSRVYVLEHTPKGCSSRELAVADLAEHHQQIDGLTEMLKEYSPRTAAPMPPEPPAPQSDQRAKTT